jgi:hypothetical protein
VNLAAGAPLWPGEWTGIGTVALAIATFLAILTTIFITRQDRKRTAKQLADERSAADKRLADEIKAADERLKTQQEHADQQFHTEQRRIIEREQYTEAYAVQVTTGDKGASPGPLDESGSPGPYTAKVLAAMVVNRGRYAITNVSAQFSPEGRSLTTVRGTVRVPGFEKIDPPLRADFTPLRDKRGHSDTLTPWDAGIRFETDAVGVAHLTGPYFVVRWVDRWGSHWEHKQGVVRPLTGNEPWMT